MSKRERYLKALRNERVDEMVWAPNFDYWLAVNTAEGTLPERYAGMSRNDIVREIGASIWCRAGGLTRELDPSVREIWFDDGDNTIHEYATPIGSITEAYKTAEGQHRSRACIMHFVRDLQSLRVMTYVAEATSYSFDPAPVYEALGSVGEDGIVLHMAGCVPFVQFAKTDAGYVNGYYLWTDYREEVDRLIGAYTAKFLEAYRLLATGPADVVSTGDNMDGTMISPAIFREYATPFYREAARALHEGSKIFEGHWCGRTQDLLSLVPDCGLDVVEAIVTRPMAEIELDEALEKLDGRVVLQGGIPAVMVCEEGCASEDFDRYIEDVIVPLKGRPGFVLGMSDNVPPNADFARVERVAELVA